MSSDRNLAKDMLGVALVAALSGFIVFEAGELRNSLDSRKERAYLERSMDSFPRGGKLEMMENFRSLNKRTRIYEVKDSYDARKYFAVAADLPEYNGTFTLAVAISLKGEISSVKAVHGARFANLYSKIARSGSGHEAIPGEIAGQSVGTALRKELEEISDTVSVPFSDISELLAVCVNYVKKIEAGK